MAGTTYHPARFTTKIFEHQMNLFISNYAFLVFREEYSLIIED